MEEEYTNQLLNLSLISFVLSGPKSSGCLKKQLDPNVLRSRVMHLAEMLLGGSREVFSLELFTSWKPFEQPCSSLGKFSAVEARNILTSLLCPL